MRCPESGAYDSANPANVPTCPAHARRYIEHLEHLTDSPQAEHAHSLRSAGALAADVHRAVLQGGIHLALKTLPTGGVFVAGGIAPKILPALSAGAFLEAFLGKGRFRSVLETMPVRVVVSDTVGLLGAARGPRCPESCLRPGE